MSIRGTAGGKNGQLDWDTINGDGGWQYTATYQGNGRWLLNTHNWVFYIASDGRLISDSGGNNDTYKFTKKTPVDCQMSGWSGWSGCSKTCGGGVQTQTRSITQQPQNGGAACGPTQQQQSCNTQACQTSQAGIDGAWTAPNGWKMSIRNTAGGKNGQIDWDNGGRWQDQAIYQNNGKWKITTFWNGSNYLDFYIANDGRLISDYFNGNDSNKFTKVGSSSTTVA